MRRSFQTLTESHLCGKVGDLRLLRATFFSSFSVFGLICMKPAQPCQRPHPPEMPSCCCSHPSTYINLAQDHINDTTDDYEEIKDVPRIPKVALEKKADTGLQRTKMGTCFALNKSIRPSCLLACCCLLWLALSTRAFLVFVAWGLFLTGKPRTECGITQGN